MKISRDVLESITAHSRETMPAECCGILMSRCGDPDVVDDILPAENVSSVRPHETYVLGHRAHMKAVDAEIADGARITGYYHSHPRGGVSPSKRDAVQAVEDAVYLVINGKNGQSEYAAWRLREKGFVEEPVEVIER